jgi:soluble lytic murein transglycosylase
LRQTQRQAALARAAAGFVLALVLSACQTPWTAAVLRESSALSPAVSTIPETIAAPVAVVAPPARVEAPREPTLHERISAMLVSNAPKMSPTDRTRVAGAIETAHRNHGVDPLLILAVIQQESRFISDAIGPGGSVGLMQVRPFVGADVAKRHNIPWAGAKTLLDPAANVQIGSCYLGEMLEMYHDPALAISAYNMGPYRVRRLVARGTPPRPAYLTSVLKHFQAFSSEFGNAPSEPVESAAAE